ncbi:MAG: DNA-binding protein [Nitrospirae bacterium]|nr:DNA-binding protein [Nitrospirota bacterium]MBF0542184.1 DNA-binding protein [Nitrospirota bacterium]
MEYCSGKQGRIFVCKLANNEDMLKELTALAEKEGLNAAYFYVVGAIKKGDLIVGPKDDIMPPIPVVRKLDQIYEVTGMGTIFPAEGKPKIHFHGAFGNQFNTMTGCLRNFSEVFLILEVIVVEILDINAKRIFDEKSQFYLLTL